MTKYSSAYHSACEKWIDEVAATNPPLSQSVLTGRLRPPALSKHIDSRMALTLADMPSYNWSGPFIPLVDRRTHKSQDEQERERSSKSLKRIKSSE